MVSRSRNEELALAALVGLAALLSAGCQVEPVSLRVAVKTDLAPGLEFHRVEAFIEGAGELITLDLVPGDAPRVLGGLGVIAEDGLPPSEARRVHLRLLDEAGGRVDERTVRIDNRASLSLTVTFTRDCRGVSCEDAAAPACLGGRCVDEGCASGEEPSCPEPECLSAEGCLASSACALGACSAGVCLEVPDPGACDVGERCDLELGCLLGVGCAAGTADCDPDRAGCEADLLAGDLACGRCGNLCGPGLSCLRGSCSAAALQIAHSWRTLCVLRDEALVAGERGWIQCRGGEFADLGTALPGGIAQIATDYFHLCARTEGLGEVYCWGSNNSGQLGDGSETDSATPVQVVGLSGAIDLDVDNHHSCAVTDAFEAYCWGNNGGGMLGDGTYDRRPTPVRVMELPAVVEIEVGTYFSCARDAPGRVYCWGSNSVGQLGRVQEGGSSVAQPVLGLEDAVELATGAGHACARRPDGAVVCWGDNEHGQLGDGSFEGRFAPTPVVGLPGAATRLALGDAHSCALLEGGAVYCWGLNDSGQLGDLSQADRPRPTRLLPITSAIDLVASESNTCVLREAPRGGTEIWCTGANFEHQIREGGGIFLSAVPAEGY